ncbi:MAG: sigma-70 family RNA polymerase sigma factor [Myxococcales bacterium]|nr:MAG: sigma-70 family RNA polymerase sigma factor [Myxococcales bacterium]
MVASRGLGSSGGQRDDVGVALAPRPLLHRVASGEPGAVADCVTCYGAVVWSLARRLSPDDADDAVQEIFIDLWRSAGRFDPGLQSEVSFVAMIARRRLIDRRRQRQRRPAPDSLDGLDPAAPGTPSEDRAEAAIALRALDTLRPEQREVLVMSAVQGLSHEEIAQQKQLPLGTVKAHARRALLRVRALLLGEPLDDDGSDRAGRGTP